MAIAYAIGRKVDDEIIRAALQPAMTGRDGTTAVALPASPSLLRVYKHPNFFTV
jgi:hypothetical protein